MRAVGANSLCSSSAVGSKYGSASSPHMATSFFLYQARYASVRRKEKKHNAENAKPNKQATGINPGALPFSERDSTASSSELTTNSCESFVFSIWLSAVQRSYSFFTVSILCGVGAAFASISGGLVIVMGALPPNAPGQRPCATDLRLPSRASSPGSLHLVCWALRSLGAHDPI